MNQGGMYEIMKMLNVLLIDKIPKETFTAEEAVAISGLCEKSITNNLTRLVNAGVLIREEYRAGIGGGAGRRVRYRFKEDIGKFLINNLFQELKEVEHELHSQH